MKLPTLGLISALMISIAAPIAAQAGTLTIYNEDCTYLKGLKRKKAVYVEVAAVPRAALKKCTDTKVKVKQGYPRTIALIERYKKEDDDVKTSPCYYIHTAEGTLQLGDHDVRGDEHSRVGCKQDFFGVCHCTKD